jgi:hypothetical protein
MRGMANKKVTRHSPRTNNDKAIYDRLQNDITVRPSHKEDDRRHRAGPGNEWDSQWKNSDVGAVFRLLGLSGRCRPDTALAGEDHVDREQEQQEAARNTEGGQPDAKQAQSHMSDESYYHQRDCRYGNRSYRGAAASLSRLAVCQRHE